MNTYDLNLKYCSCQKHNYFAQSLKYTKNTNASNNTNNTNKDRRMLIKLTQT